MPKAASNIWFDMEFLTRNGKHNHAKNVTPDEALPTRNLKWAKLYYRVSIRLAE